MKYSTFIPEDYDNSVSPSNGAISTAGDYMNFLMMILNKGTFMDKRILSEASILQMQTIQAANVIKKYSPKWVDDAEYGLGEWITDNNKVLLAPSLTGTLPLVDLCRNYACLFFIKNKVNEDKKELYQQLKTAIDNQIPTTCN